MGNAPAEVRPIWAPLTMTDWNFNMEDAPRDGTAVLGWSAGDSYPLPIRWYAYNAESAAEMDEDGFWEVCESLLSDIAGSANPIAWLPIQPLPPPPGDISHG